MVQVCTGPVRGKSDVSTPNLEQHYKTMTFTFVSRDLKGGWFVV